MEFTWDRNITAALRTARPAHLSVAARAVTRIGLGRRVQLVQQATTYQEANVLVARTPVVQEHTARVVIALAVPRTTRAPHARLGLIKMVTVLLAHLARLAITRVMLANTARVVIALAAMRTTHVPHARSGLIKMWTLLLAHLVLIALRTAILVHQMPTAAVTVNRIGLGRRVTLAKQVTTYQATSACPALLTVAARQVRVCVRAMQG